MNGRWEFTRGGESAPPPDSWPPHEVSGKWRRAGFEVAEDAVGWYRRSFSGSGPGGDVSSPAGVL
ncbi:MAG: hypothetical protein ABEJ55_07305 [Halanaeroarchaeum sp.]